MAASVSSQPNSTAVSHGSHVVSQRLLSASIVDWWSRPTAVVHDRQLRGITVTKVCLPIPQSAHGTSATIRIRGCRVQRAGEST